MAKRMRAKSKVDRISALPDELLLHILSFFPTKFAACTSVLSKRWRFLFTLMTNLDFACNTENDPYKFEKEKQFINFVDKLLLIQRDNQAKRFVNFVDSALLFHNRPSIQRFCLNWHINIGHLPIDKWIDALICHNIQEIELLSENHIRPSKLQIPASLFSCETLVTLKLLVGTPGDSYTVNISARASLPKLKVLHIWNASMSGHFVEKLLSSCPVLDDLVLWNCHLETSESPSKLNISNASLRRLNIRFSSQKRDIKIVINCPDLVCLLHYISDNQSLVLLAKESLQKAVISGCFCYQVPVANYDPEVLKEIKNIQSLYIQDCTIKGIYKHNIVMPLFNKLTFLKICDWKFIYDHRSLENLLAHCVVLETLVFEQQGPLSCTAQKINENHNFLDQSRLVGLLGHLKIIKIHQLNFRNDEMKALMNIIEFFVKNVEVYEKFNVFFKNLPTKSKRSLKMVKRILALPSVSKKLRVVAAERKGPDAA